MKKIIVLLILGLMIFGCLGPATPPSGGGTTPGGGTPTGSINSYSAALAAGAPLTCTYTAEGMSQTVYMKGQNMYIVGTSGGQPVEAIFKDNVSYVKLTAEAKQSFQEIGKTCDWMSFKQEGEAQGGIYQPPDRSSYSDPNVQWTCNAALFGDEKFQPSGGVCTMEELISGYQAQMPPPG